VRARCRGCVPREGELYLGYSNSRSLVGKKRLARDDSSTEGGTAILLLEFEEDFGGDFEVSAEVLDVMFVERALAAQNLGNHTFGTEHRSQVFLAHVVCFHQGSEDFDGGGGTDGVMLLFVGLDQVSKDLRKMFFLRGQTAAAFQFEKSGSVAFVFSVGGDRFGHNKTVPFVALNVSGNHFFQHSVTNGERGADRRATSFCF
jgi:hypothetical protein